MFLCDYGSVHFKPLRLSKLLQNGALFVSVHSEGLWESAGTNKKTPIWRLALRGTDRTFTQEGIYHRGIGLSMGKFWRAVEDFEDSAGFWATGLEDLPRWDGDHSTLRS
jgi:hypothetical protein